jgi:hypothetical protein
MMIGIERVLVQLMMLPPYIKLSICFMLDGKSLEADSPHYKMAIGSLGSVILLLPLAIYTDSDFKMTLSRAENFVFFT